MEKHIFNFASKDDNIVMEQVDKFPGDEASIRSGRNADLHGEGVEGRANNGGHKSLYLGPLTPVRSAWC